jgi:hypothetical protein
VAHPDLDRLLNSCLQFAQEALKKRKAFYPFAATIGTDGELKQHAVYSGNDHPQPQTLIDEFTLVLKDLAQKGEAVATAICYDSRVSTDGSSERKKDAIAVTLEHSNGESVLVFLPYNKKLLGGFSYDPLIAQVGEHKFFS